MMALVPRPLDDYISLTDFACLVQTNLSTVTLGQPVLSRDIISQLDDQLNGDLLNTRAGDNADLKRLDAMGTSLWNTCSQLIVARGQFSDDLCTIGKARALAFGLVNVAAPAKMLGWLRSLACSLIAAQTCIATRQLNVAYKILTVSAARLKAVQPSNLGLDVTLNYSLTTKYWLLRVRLAAQEQRFDIAEHLWSKVPTPFLNGDRESVLETSFFVGDYALLTFPPVAIHWFQVAHKTLLELQTATGQNFAAFKTWDLVIAHSLGVACLPNLTTESPSVLKSVLENIKVEYPQHPAVVLLHATMNTAATTQSLVDSGCLAKSHYETQHDNVGESNSFASITSNDEIRLFQFIHFLEVKSRAAAVGALCSLLLVPLPREWTDKCFLAYLLLMSRCSNRDPRWIQGTESVIKALDHRGYPSFGPNTAHAAVVCLWKLIGLAIEKGEFNVAVGWLLICKDPKIAANCTQDTQYHISRKLVACYMQIGNITSARYIMKYGLTQGQFDCKKVYLDYRLAMLEGTELSGFFRFGFPDDPPILQKQTCLLSCAIEAQLQNKPNELMSCLGQLVECSTSGDIPHVDFSPAEHHMFLICLVLKELAKYQTNEFYTRANEVLANALQYAKEHSCYEGGDCEISVTQLQWFYQASYRMGVQLAHYQNVEVTLQALRYSHEFTLLYRRIAGIEGRVKAPRPHFFLINFVRIITYADGARRSSEQEKKKAYYSSLRAAFQTLRGLVGWEDGQENPNEVSAAIEGDQFLVGAFFDFEATIQLGLWNELLEICRDPDRFPKTRFYPQMLDLALQIGTPAAVQVAVMKQIVNNIFELVTQGSPDAIFYLPKMPRYFYCLFSIATSSDPANTELSDGLAMVDFVLAEELLEQIYTLAKLEASKEDNNDGDFEIYQADMELYVIGGKNPFPALELEQVARLTFNKAADFYASGDGGVCFRWAQKSIELARLVPGSAGEALVMELELRKKFLE
ncbi:unnamed protein product [Penicillium salamii]|nr:unnamed protein product [Penicillium salamii]